MVLLQKTKHTKMGLMVKHIFAKATQESGTIEKFPWKIRDSAIKIPFQRRQHQANFRHMLICTKLCAFMHIFSKFDVDLENISIFFTKKQPFEANFNAIIHFFSFFSVNPANFDHKKPVFFTIQLVVSKAIHINLNIIGHDSY